MKEVRYLNLYAGLGGNRRLLPRRVKVTAVEYDPKIATLYKKLYPQDILIVGDAHEYLEKHYKEFDFIWSSPPCVTLTRLNHTLKNKRYPSMTLWQEIVFLHWFCKCAYVVENVKMYYQPLFKPTIEAGRHLYWSNFSIPLFDETSKLSGSTRFYQKQNQEHKIKTIKLRGWPKWLQKENLGKNNQMLNNLVMPEVGLHIFNKSGL